MSRARNNQFNRHICGLKNKPPHGLASQREKNLIQKYTNPISASDALLTETTKLLLGNGVNFVVVGGWAPFIFHSKKFGHPGTFDVDILLDSQSLDDGSFEKATEALLSSDYMRAPKNTFQAHKIMDVAGEKLVFHVDFLNERNLGEEVEVVGGKGKLHSIYTDSMKAVFKYNEYRYNIAYPDVPFPSPETFIATKAAAANVKKRQRDAFDVFVTAIDQSEGFAKKWKELCESDGLFHDANDELAKAINEGEALEKITHVLEGLHTEGKFNSKIPNEGEIKKAFSFLIAS